MERFEQDEISARVERLLTAQPSAPPEARRVRRSFVIDSRWQESKRYMGLTITVDSEFARAYRRPGQYITIKAPGWPPRFFVIAGRPQSDQWEFLIDRSGELGPVLSQADVGSELSLSLPEGTGFDPDEGQDSVVMMFCTGSGVATMRPVVEQWLADDAQSPKKMILYYGEKHGEDFAYEALMSNWESQGVEIYRSVEQGQSKKIPFRYVQDAFDAHHPEVDDALVYLSGAPVMVQMVAEKMLRTGVAPSRVKINI